MHGTDPSEWLAQSAPDPKGCRLAWRVSWLGVALLQAGQLWDLVVLPHHLGCASLEIMVQSGTEPGPVLADVVMGRIGFFVPPGTAAQGFGGCVRCVGAGTWVAVPDPARKLGRLRWLVPPGGRVVLTDPELLWQIIDVAAGTDPSDSCFLDGGLSGCRSYPSYGARAAATGVLTGSQGLGRSSLRLANAED